jgi:dihydrofolate reductase
LIRPRFTLTVAATADGFIAKGPGHAPVDWVSAEEQALFFRDVEAADWSVMGRGTHEAAPRRDRRRIVFSSQIAGWQEKCQFWCDPRGMTPTDLAREVEKVHALRHGLILGGTRVHDWFLAHGAIDDVHLTIEPVEWGAGLPIFTGSGRADPVAVFAERGFVVVEEAVLNSRGTRWLRMVPAASVAGQGIEE